MTEDDMWEDATTPGKERCCECCGDSDEVTGPLCDGCDCCGGCCECTETECDCNTCIARRELERERWHSKDNGI